MEAYTVESVGGIPEDRKSREEGWFESYPRGAKSVSSCEGGLRDVCVLRTKGGETGICVSHFGDPEPAAFPPHPQDPQTALCVENDRPVSKPTISSSASPILLASTGDSPSVLGKKADKGLSRGSMKLEKAEIDYFEDDEAVQSDEKRPHTQIAHTQSAHLPDVVSDRDTCNSGLQFDIGRISSVEGIHASSPPRSAGESPKDDASSENLTFEEGENPSYDVASERVNHRSFPSSSKRVLGYEKSPSAYSHDAEAASFRRRGEEEDSPSEDALCVSSPSVLRQQNRASEEANDLSLDKGFTREAGRDGGDKIHGKTSSTIGSSSDANADASLGTLWSSPNNTRSSKDEVHSNRREPHRIMYSKSYSNKHEAHSNTHTHANTQPTLGQLHSDPEDDSEEYDSHSGASEITAKEPGEIEQSSPELDSEDLKPTGEEEEGNLTAPHSYSKARGSNLDLRDNKSVVPSENVLPSEGVFPSKTSASISPSDGVLKGSEKGQIVEIGGGAEAEDDTLDMEPIFTPDSDDEPSHMGKKPPPHKSIAYNEAAASAEDILRKKRRSSSSASSGSPEELLTPEDEPSSSPKEIEGEEAAEGGGGGEQRSGSVSGVESAVCVVEDQDASSTAERGSGKLSEALTQGSSSEVQNPPCVLHNSLLHGCLRVEIFKKLNKISEGTYGAVFRAMNRFTNELVALKQIKYHEKLWEEGFPITSLREISILLELNHENIVFVKEVVVGKGPYHVFMVMEYVEHELRALLEDNKPEFSVSERKCLLLQLLRAIEYLHKNWVMHRDLKTSNLLYSNKGVLKLCDFGMARKFGDPMRSYTHNVVTLWYRAPELLLGQKTYSEAVDIWAAGCIFGEIILRKPVFPGHGEADMIKRILKLCGTPDDTTWPGFSKLPAVKKGQYFAKLPVFQPSWRNEFPLFQTHYTGVPGSLSEAGLDLLQKLLEPCPEKRITASEALQHRYFYAEKPQPQLAHLMPTVPDTNSQVRKKRRRDLSLEKEEQKQLEAYHDANSRFGGRVDAAKFLSQLESQQGASSTKQSSRSFQKA